MKSGLHNDCKKCHNFYHKQHRIENKERDKQWSESNREEVLQYKKKYRQKHKEDIKEKNKQWFSENKGKNISYRQKRKALKCQLSNTLTIQQWKNIKLSFNNCCAYCGKELPLAQEHFIALSKGGEYTQNNIITSCKSCNSSKSNKDFFTWYSKYKYYSKKREKAILKFLGYENGEQQLKII